ncbi:sigma-54-dependent Fis family transcriptional regulator [Pectinatus brassicae]|uniref:PAS domain S-box-containing protein n=1 Tax=Pectinatus brassicae TaxID=862415 RepID=A0A840UMF9_9FIRM|nr:sigma-54-dependent Fis family transcriptional regulator [Pectinatus brassicae]MBB5336997.1 PAS domain S-box-containing protein [Pectinatus brassicae]
MLVRDLMQENPLTLYADEHLHAAINLFNTYHTKAIPIMTRENKLCGILTKTDLLITFDNCNKNPHTTIDKIMTKNIVSVHPEDSLDKIKILFRYTPVTDTFGNLVGLLGKADVFNLSYQRMRRAENAVKQLADISYSGIIIIDEKQIITQINKTAADLLNTSIKYAVGHLASDFSIEHGLTEMMQTGRSEIGLTLKINNNSLIISRAPILAGYRVVGGIITIKASSEREKALLNQVHEQTYILDRFNCIFESICQGIIAVDLDQKIYYANHAYEDIMGIPRENLIGHHVENAVENSRVPVVLHTGIPEFGAVQTVNERKVIVNRLPIFKDGKIIGAIGQAVFKNINEVERLLKRNKQLIDTNNKKKTANIHQLATFENIIGTSNALLKAKNLAAKVAPTDTTVLIQGESGTGKDLFAQAIHTASQRQKAKFIAVNCAAIPSELLESELFGYDEGAFTGAKKGGKKGKFELAEGGTLFLDEIGDMPLNMQAKLLRVIQNKVFERVGGETARTCDVRIIAATNQNLQKLVTAGKFREDLYYRLHVVCIDVPALRMRKDDIDDLLDALIPDICTRLNVSAKTFSPEAIDILKQCLWPGNIRELINFIEQISTTVDSSLIRAKHLPTDLLGEYNQTLKSDTSIIDGEQARIAKAIIDANGNKSLAAKLLGMHRSTLYLKIKKYNLNTD